MFQAGPYRLSADPVEFFQLNETERRQVQEIRDRLAIDGGVLYAYDENGEPKQDQAGQPVPVDWIVLRMRRFLLDKHGLIWAYKYKGASKSRRDPTGGGVPFRHAAIEMWTGKWRRCIHPKTGEPTYAKRTMWVPIETQINLPSGKTHLDYYRNQKGFKHPLELPDAPTDFDMRVMERRRVDIDGVVYAKAQEYAAKAGDDASMAAAEQAVADMEATASARQKPKRRKKAKKRISARRTVAKNEAAEAEAVEAVATAPVRRTNKRASGTGEA